MLLPEAIGELLHVAGDPDWRVYSGGRRNFGEGVPLGYREPLPRTPAVFRRKVKWRQYDDDKLQWQQTGNYGQTDERRKAIHAQFEAERSLGMMTEKPLAAARIEFGQRLRIASLGSLAKSDESYRVLHDGTHRVLINPEVRPRDQIEVPGIGQEKFIMGDLAARGSSAFSLVADVEKAHRRFKVLPRDHGLVACQLEPDKVWLNHVGVFGIGSSGYWFARLIAGPTRLTMMLFGRELLWMLLYSDDYKWVSAGAGCMTNLLLAIFFLQLLGVPLAYRKFRGGLEVEWIGYAMDYKTFSAGISESRCQWLIGFVADIVATGVVVISDFEALLGRLGFAAGPLELTRPFLSFGYAWVHTVPRHARVQLPLAVLLTLKWILGRLRHGLRLQRFHLPVLHRGEWFRSDARASVSGVAIGDWECLDRTEPQHARWFAVELTPANAPWAFWKGDPKRAIASLELHLWCRVRVCSRFERHGRTHLVDRCH